MEPLKLQPIFKDYLWGGTKLKTDYNKQTNMEIVAESWELACHKDNKSVIINSEFAGKTLSSYIEKYGRDILGTNCDRFEYFPILIKFIDAKDNLSVQVHPENEYALRVEGEYGKTEMWYILDCEKDASLLYGFKHNISKSEFRQRIEDNTLLEVLNSVPVKKGDVFFIEAGTLHAIGSGIVIAEIQQNSNTTYRVYDYGRVSADGKPRELHIEKAKDVTHLSPPTHDANPMGKCEHFNGYSKILLATCEYFNVNSIKVELSCKLCVDNTSFNSLLCIEGSGFINYSNEVMSVEKGDSIFIPADFGEFTINGVCEFLITNICK
jgi:mannose-6-phosphate isomerase